MHHSQIIARLHREKFLAYKKTKLFEEIKQIKVSQLKDVRVAKTIHHPVQSII